MQMEKQAALTTPAIPTTNKHLIRWVEKMADLCQPSSIHWIDGSAEENKWALRLARRSWHLHPPP